MTPQEELQIRERLERGGLSAAEELELREQLEGGSAAAPPIPDPVLPPTVPESGVEQGVRSAVQGMTAGGSDELTALQGALKAEAGRALPKTLPRGAGATPSLPFIGEMAMNALLAQYGKGRGVSGALGSEYGPRLKEERARLEAVPPLTRIPNEIVGSMVTGGVGAGPLLKRVGTSTAGRIGASAGTGAASGATYGFLSGEGAEDRGSRAVLGAGLGAFTGGGVGLASGALAKRAARKTIPTTESLRKEATAAYEAAERSGIVVAQPSFAGVVRRIQTKMANEGMDKTIHPNVTAAMTRLTDDASKGHISLKGVEILRRVIRDAASPNNPSEQRLAGKMLKILDDYMENLGGKDVIGGKAGSAAKSLKNARGLWSRYRKTEFIEELIERAKNSAPKLTQSGYENALRQQFRNLANNKKQMRRFTPQEKAAIKKVARGGPVQNLLRRIGNFAPRGHISGTLMVGTTVLDPTVGVAALIGSEAARRAATRATSRNVGRITDLTRTGGALPAPVLPPMLQRALTPAIVGGATLPQRAIDALPRRVRK